MVRLRVTLPDHPGGLEKVAALIASHGANIVQATHDRTYFGVHLGEAMIDVTMETRGPQHVDQLLTKLTAAGYPFERVM
jgi:threonine dehydratase